MKKASKYVDDVLDGSWMVIRGGIMLAVLGVKALVSAVRGESAKKVDGDGGEVIDVECSEGESNG